MEHLKIETQKFVRILKQQCKLKEHGKELRDARKILETNIVNLMIKNQVPRIVIEMDGKEKVFEVSTLLKPLSAKEAKKDSKHNKKTKHDSK